MAEAGKQLSQNTQHSADDENGTRSGGPSSSPDRFHRTLFAAIDAIQREGIPYALIGGVAVRGLGRPRVTKDIDIFVRPDHAEKVLRLLEREGFTTEKRDPHWLFKAWKDEVLVDIIFRSSGDIYLDEELQERIRSVSYYGRTIKAVSPEDFAVIKSAVAREDGPHHWYDALAVLTNRDLDWEYLLSRARNAPRRMLALLIYAQSNDILVPTYAIERLYSLLYGGERQEQRSRPMPRQRGESVRESRVVQFPVDGRAEGREGRQEGAPRGKGGEELPIYLAGRIKQAIVEDPRTGDQDVKIIVGDHRVVVRGETSNKDQCEAVIEVIRSCAPGYEIENQLQVRVLPGPEGTEAVL